MPQSQESKVKPIENAVKPSQPFNVMPPSKTEISFSIGGEQDTLKGQSIPTQTTSSLELGGLEQDNGIEISGLTPVDPIEIGGLKPVDSKLMEKAKEAYEWLDQPHKWARPKAVEGIDKLFRMAGYEDRVFDGVWGNVLLGTPKVIVEAMAETGVDLTLDPLMAATAGYSKGMGALMKSPVGKKVIKPFLKASADYYAGRIPEMMSKTSHRTKMIVADMALGVSNALDYVAKDAVGSGTIAKGLIEATKLPEKAISKSIDLLNKVSPSFEGKPIITRWTSYKYGLPSVEKFLDLMRTDKRMISNIRTYSARTGHTLWNGLSKEAQDMAMELIESGKWVEDDIERAGIIGLENLKALGIKDPQKFSKDVVNARRIIDEWSERYANDFYDAGLIDDKVYDIVMKNRGKFVRRLFRIFSNKELSSKVSSGEVTLVDAMGLAEGHEKKFAELGFSKKWIGDFNSMSEKKKLEFAKKLGVRYKGNRISHKAYINSDALKKRKMLTEVEQRVLGIEPIGYRVAKTEEWLRTQVQRIKTTRIISENPEWAVPIKGNKYVTHGWVKLVGNKYGYLNHHWVNPQVVDELYRVSQTNMDGEIGRWSWGLWKKLLGNWKIWKVPLNPGSHFNNTIGQAMINDMSGFDILSQGKYVNIADKEIKRGYGKWFKMAEEDNLFTPARSTEELFIDIENPTEAIAREKAKGLKRIPQKARDLKIGAINKFMGIDNKYKLARYIWEIEGGATRKEALTESLKWNFDYERISPFIRAIRDNPLLPTPFFTFSALAAPRLIETALENPLAYLKWHTLFQNFDEASLRELKATKKDYEYLRSKKGYFLTLPARTKTGKPVTMNIEPWWIGADLLNWVRGDKADDGWGPKVEGGGPGKLFHEAWEGKTTGKYGKNLFEAYDPKRVQYKKQIAHFYNGYFASWMPSPDMLLSPVQSLLRYGSKKTGIDIIGKDKLTFESDNVLIGGRSSRRLANSVYHDITDIIDDGDGVTHKQISDRFQEVFNPEVINDFKDEATIPTAVLYALFGMNIEPIDPTMFHVMDASKVKSLDENGEIYRMFLRKLSSTKLTKKQRIAIIGNYKENLLMVIKEFREAKKRFEISDEENEQIDNSTTP